MKKLIIGILLLNVLVSGCKQLIGCEDVTREELVDMCGEDFIKWTEQVPKGDMLTYCCASQNYTPLQFVCNATLTWRNDTVI